MRSLMRSLRGLHQFTTTLYRIFLTFFDCLLFVERAGIEAITYHMRCICAQILTRME